MAQDWSDEVRMTHFGDHNLSTFYFEKDSDDNLHFLFKIGNWGDDGRGQAVYQKFNRIGEPLTDPIQVSEITNVPDTTEAGTRAVDLFLSADSVVHILSCTRHSDTNYRFYHSRLDLDGNAIADAVLLEGLGDIPYYPSDHPYSMVVDSRDNVIIGGSSLHFFGDTTRTFHVFYQKYNFEGETLGNIHFLDQRGFEYWGSLNILSNDNLAFVWSENHQSINSVYYCLVAPNDSIIVDNFDVSADDGWGSVNYEDFEMDSENNLVVLLKDPRQYIYVRKYDIEMDRIYQVPLGREYYRQGDIFIDRENSVHIGKGFLSPDESIYVGYSRIDNEGNLLDSADVVYGREELPRGYWHDIKTFTCRDGFTGVFWLDDRWGAYQKEIILKFKNSQHVFDEHDHRFYPDKPVIHSMYPNPFNSSICINFILPPSCVAKLIMTDILGRIVYNQEIIDNVQGYHTLVWNGTDQNGEILPSGSYWIRLKSNNLQATEKVVLVR